LSERPFSFSSLRYASGMSIKWLRNRIFPNLSLIRLYLPVGVLRAPNKTVTLDGQEERSHKITAAYQLPQRPKTDEPGEGRPAWQRRPTREGLGPLGSATKDYGTT
ncbi:MAG: hypothetical protein WB628_12955, partial [Candidatus Sulfotelmatobacter sp.]